MTTPFTQIAKERLLGAINNVNPHFVIEMSDIVFGVPVTVNENNRNTKIALLPSATSPFKKKKSIFYNRLSLARYFSEVTTPTLNVPNPTTSHALIPLLLAQKDVAFETSDILLETIPNGATAYTLKANPASVGWYGQVTLTFDAGVRYGVLLDSGAKFLTDSGAFFIFDDVIITE